MNPSDLPRRRATAEPPHAVRRKSKGPVGSGQPDLPRCAWAQSDPLLRAYHDEEWGIPERDSRALWEKLMLDGFQAGLSWLIILRKRGAFRRAFQGFDPQIVARFGPADVKRLLADAGIVRSRAKIEATIGNAQAYLRMAAAGEDFSAFVWGMVGGSPIRNSPRHPGEVPAKTALSEQMSVALKQRGFRFVGPVIVYAWMQATGLVDDHLTGCFRRAGAGGGKTRKTSGLIKGCETLI